jgi:hypothetical protein
MGHSMTKLAPLAVATLFGVSATAFAVQATETDYSGLTVCGHSKTTMLSSSSSTVGALMRVLSR